jgi:hypothetical protein
MDKDMVNALQWTQVDTSPFYTVSSQLQAKSAKKPKKSPYNLRDGAGAFGSNMIANRQV